MIFNCCFKAAFEKVRESISALERPDSMESADFVRDDNLLPVLPVGDAGLEEPVEDGALAGGPLRVVGRYEAVDDGNDFWNY